MNDFLIKKTCMKDFINAKQRVGETYKFEIILKVISKILVISMWFLFVAMIENLIITRDLK